MPDRLTTIPLPSGLACPEFPSFSNWSGQGCQAPEDSLGEGVDQSKRATSMSIPWSSGVKECVEEVTFASHFHGCLTILVLEGQMANRINPSLTTPNQSEKPLLTVIPRMCTALPNVYGISTPITSATLEDSPVSRH